MTLRHSICICNDTLCGAHCGLAAGCGHTDWSITATINESLQINAVIIMSESIAEQTQILLNKCLVAQQQGLSVFSNRLQHTVF